VATYLELGTTGRSSPYLSSRPHSFLPLSPLFFSYEGMNSSNKIGLSHGRHINKRANVLVDDARKPPSAAIHGGRLFPLLKS